MKRAPAKSTGRTKTTQSPAPATVVESIPAKLKLKSILVPLDYSPESKKALRYALAFAAQFGARLTLIHVVAPMPMADFYSFPMAVENDQLIANCQEHLARLVKEHAVDPGVVERTIVCVGQPVHEITEAARKYTTDLIIISTHGHTGAAHLLLGSTTERVVRHAHCPVLVVRQHEHEFI